LVERENLRYRRSEEQIKYDSQDKQSTLRLSDLISGRSYLRKPDFQRTTWAWTPEECVSLLESVINKQVIPSIIMWESPENGFHYILDGGHRISVVLAWLKNDWGEKFTADDIDDEQLQMIRHASIQVSQLVQIKIGNIQTYDSAEKELVRAVDEGKSPKEELPPNTFRQGVFYQSLLKGDISFHVLWVRGDYKTAEQSFLKINKSGRQLSEWETTLVENRNSSFARSVMSISSGSTAPHYWPEDNTRNSLDSDLQQKVREILSDIKYLQNILFQPTYTTPIQQLQQPFLVASIQDRPRYVAELLTITEGFRGQEPETQKLLIQHPDGDAEQIINNGWNLLRKAVDIFEHLNGNSNQPKSLALVPALYFYSDAGRYVRSLLYGFIYWMFKGSEEDILNRKKLFTVYRSGFEQVIRSDKSAIVSTFSRKTGSGPEVTLQTGTFYNDLLELLITYKGDITSAQFQARYDAIFRRTSKPDSEAIEELRSRSFTEKQKSRVLLARILDSQISCEICGGMLDPEGNVQHDHIIQYAQGGRTTHSNQRVVHPFCNNQRNAIEKYRNDSQVINLPQFSYLEDLEGPKQLSMFPDSAFE